MTAQPISRVASRIPVDVAQAFVAGLAVDVASRRAGHADELAGRGPDCPAGLDMFSYYLGRAEARRYAAPARRSPQGEGGAA